MSSLKSLDVGENPIKQLPSSIAKLKNLESLYVKGINQEFSNLRNDLRLKKLVILK